MSEVLTIGPAPEVKYVEWISNYETKDPFTLTGLMEYKIGRLEVTPVFAAGKFLHCNVSVVYLLTPEQAELTKMELPGYKSFENFDWKIKRPEGNGDIAGFLDYGGTPAKGDVTLSPEMMALFREKQAKAGITSRDSDEPFTVGG